jgi:hypothetical protein
MYAQSLKVMIPRNNCGVEFDVILIKRFTYVNPFCFHTWQKDMNEKPNSFPIFGEEKKDRKTVNYMVNSGFGYPILNWVLPTCDCCTHSYERSENLAIAWKDLCLIDEEKSVGCRICTRNCLAEASDEFDPSILVWKVLCVTSLRNYVPSKLNRGFWRLEGGN